MTADSLKVYIVTIIHDYVIWYINIGQAIIYYSTIIVILGLL